MLETAAASSSMTTVLLSSVLSVLSFLSLVAFGEKKLMRFICFSEDMIRRGN